MIATLGDPICIKKGDTRPGSTSLSKIIDKKSSNALTYKATYSVTVVKI